MSTTLKKAGARLIAVLATLSLGRGPGRVLRLGHHGHAPRRRQLQPRRPEVRLRLQRQLRLRRLPHRQRLRDPLLRAGPVPGLRVERRLRHGPGLQNGECRECLVDDHCPSGTLCGTDHKCHTACTTNIDCTNPERPICNLDNNDCVECLANTDCGTATPICDNEKKCAECVAAADCLDPAAPLCDKNECVQCIDDQDCTDVNLPKCDNGVCAPN